MKLSSALAIAVTMLAASSVFASAPKPKITPAKAAKIALAKYPGTLVKAAHYEHEDGVWQYEVLIRTKKNQMLEVDVNAMTGKIGDVEKTSAAEEAKETKSNHKD
jgi:uncharacterized membrane protein YkoI